ncbi:MAG: glycosyltransferase family 4 protein [Desulfobulbaceae bacterium]|nr:glycosyltransferase family 4 protein [Desulfobulbaceae bacterium]
MKILHLISQHPESTGSGFYLQNIIRQATARGHSNYLIAGVSDNQLPQLKCIEKASCQFVHFAKGTTLNFSIPGMSDVMPYPSSRFSSLSPAQLDKYEKEFEDTLQQAIEKFTPDIIHSHHLWIASSVARKCCPDMPMVTSCHSTELRQFFQCPHLQARVLHPCRKIDRILSLSHSQAEEITKTYSIDPEKIDIVGGGYADDLFQLHPKGSPAPIQLLYGGKLSFAKGVDWLLRTVNNLKASDIHLHLAGSGAGEEARQCLELASREREKITVHGRISQQKLAHLMGRCHIFILPSFYEGLPLVLLEALASGCRIITTDLKGCRELLGDTDSDLVEFVQLPEMKTIDSPYPEDQQLLEKRLGEGLKRMIDRVQRLPSPDPNQIRTITSRFRWQSVFARIEKSYEKVISRSRTAS